MNNPNILYEIGITLIKGIGPVIARQLIDTLEDVSLLFTEKKYKLERILPLSRRLIREIHDPAILKRAEQELHFLEQTGNRPLFITSPLYPQRLKDCADAPVLLYLRGNVDLNARKVVSIVGTRHITTYGKEVVGKLVAGFRETFPDILVVSGLAYGVDVAAHKAALHEEIRTIGVLAHGLDRVYPPGHREIAIEMLKSGGLLTEYRSNTFPDKQNFVKRNRIVAGMADCTVIIESAAKGGALITAGIAVGYNRDVLAYPGKSTDRYSEGCNNLIKERKAALITCAEDLFREMNWTPRKTGPTLPVQRTFFPVLNGEEQKISDLLLKKRSMQLNQLVVETNLPVSKLSVILFEMEMNGVIRCRAGGLYELV